MKINDSIKYISPEEAAQLIPYSPQYLRLRIIQGKLKGLKIDGRWMTTEVWLNDYMARVNSWKAFQRGYTCSAGPRERNHVSLSNKSPPQLFAMSSAVARSHTLQGPQNGSRKSSPFNSIGIFSTRTRHHNEVIHLQDFDKEFLGIGDQILALNTAKISHRASLSFQSQLALASFLLLIVGFQSGILTPSQIKQSMIDAGERVLALSSSLGDNLFSLSSSFLSSLPASISHDLSHAKTLTSAIITPLWSAPASYTANTVFTPFGTTLFHTLSQGLTSVKTLLTRGVDSLIAFFTPQSPNLASNEHPSLNPSSTSPSLSTSTPSAGSGQAEVTGIQEAIDTTKQKFQSLPPVLTEAPPAASVITTLPQGSVPSTQHLQAQLDALNQKNIEDVLSLTQSLLSVASKANQVDTRASNIVTLISNTQKIDTLDKITVSDGLTLSSGNLDVQGGTLTVAKGATITGGGSFGGNLSAGGTLTATGSFTTGGSITANGTGTSTFAGPVSIAGILTVNSNSLTISSTSTVTTQFTVTRAPVNTHSFVSWSPGTSNSNVTDASLLVNPASAAADTNLLGLAVNSSPVFLVDADGDVFAKSVTLSGGSTLATTTIGGNVSIEGNTTLGDAPNNDTTLINGYTRH